MRIPISNGLRLGIPHIPDTNNDIQGDRTLKNPPTAAAVFDFWRACEMFNPQGVPKIAPADEKWPVFRAQPDAPLPWESAHELGRIRLKPGETRRYMVYAGVFPLERAIEMAEELVGKDPQAFNQGPAGDACVLGFQADEQGRPLFDTFLLASCAWALSRTVSPGPRDPRWLHGFEEVQKAAKEDFELQFALQPGPDGGAGRGVAGVAAGAGTPPGTAPPGSGSPAGKAITTTTLLAYTERVVSRLGLSGRLGPLQVRVEARVISQSKADAADETDLINSLYEADLALVATQARKHNYGEALAQYVRTQPAVTQRVDVRTAASRVFEQLQPAAFPPGRWPGAGHHPLVFSQQLAINAMVGELGAKPGMFSVNGPPGTGKTTLLRDLVAAVVVQRARRLAELDRPEDAFAGTASWMSGDYKRVVALWKDRFKGFEIVVASANNGAVANISLELPGRGAVDASWLDGLDYFRDFAQRAIEAPAWGLVAAQLGNKKLRMKFTSAVWRDRPESVAGKPVTTPEGAAAAKMSSAAAQNLRDYLTKLQEQPEDWRPARARFQNALRAEASIRQARQGYYQASLDATRLVREKMQATHELSQKAAERDTAQATERDAAQRAHHAQDAAQQRETERLAHRRFRPGLLEIIFSLGKRLKVWMAHDEALAAACDAASAARGQALQEHALAKIASERANGAHRVAELAVMKLDVELQGAIAVVNEGRAKLGAAFPDLPGWHKDDAARELSSPWADPVWNEARADLFCAAMQLHKAFIHAVPATMRKSLHAAMDVLEGSAPRGAPQAAVEAAWTALFFLVPVVSSTFASFGRMFSHLGREAIGWLLIDEAGQATPGAAAGAIWRAQRAVVVGDPLQLEPIVPLPFTVQQALRRHYGVDEAFLPQVSAQQLADRVNRWGTNVRLGDEQLWVGAPLRVHRRCDRVMFDISNRVAYDGKMVFGTGKRPPMEGLIESQWIHVGSTHSEGHWVPQEGLVTEQLLAELFTRGVKPGNVFLITPFRNVVDRLKRIASRHPGIQAGTIHTVQGKEADVVILVLGGDPGKPGVKKWASGKPNLVNVAASRARRRLFVIGNRDEWRKFPYFSAAAALLLRPGQA